MGITQLDVFIIIFYLILVAIIGSLSGGKQRTTKDYFLGGESIPWWAVTFSIVAAETSSLTFISVPGLAYVGNLNFLQLSIGFLLARIIIAILFLPAYKKGQLTTAYAFLESRFGKSTRRYASIVFLFTRIAADGVRLFATAIPLALLLKSNAYFSAWSNVQIYVFSILIIASVSFLYTYTGGVKGVIWVDVVQMFIYLGGSAAALIILLDRNASPAVEVSLGEKLQLFNFDWGGSITGFFSKPYTLLGSLVGGTFLSLASHGTDQLIVQRLLTTRSLKDGRKAIITSGILVMLQFALFLTVGLLLYKFYQGLNLADAAAPFHKADEIFPYFIIHELPAGFKGFIIAGLLAAAMSTLAGSMSSLSSSAMFDLYKPIFGQKSDSAHDLHISRIFTVTAAVILTGVSFLFIRLNQSVVEIALGIASITYGGLLGTFLLGLVSKSVGQKGALIGFSCGIIVMASVSLIPILFGMAPLLHYTWYVALGSAVTIITGVLIKK
jgi:SSS family transporter